MSDRFSTEMTLEELVEYIRRTPKKFSGELPEKMEKWMNAKIIELEEIKKQALSHHSIVTEEYPLPSADQQRHEEIKEHAFRIIERHAPHVAMEPKTLVDYAFEITEEFFTQLKTK